MAHRFGKHYTVEEAEALLPRIRLWIEQLHRLRTEVGRLDTHIGRTMAEGADAGGGLVDRWTRAMADIRDVFREFQQREIQIKDLERGLVDFPALIGGNEVFLCWETGEDKIEFWHDLDSGYAGRERL
ncbi:MAG: DUF2203 domain-containing protein [Verrucomicrobia bacterium]|nr:DUF2203 domain-containing protein [Verrucomicrobiota bacterium]